MCLAGPVSAEVGRESFRKWLPLPEGAWDSGAYGDEDHAVVLYKGHILDDSSAKGNGRHHVYERILVRDRTGVDESTSIQIPYEKGESIADLAARTVKPDGTVLELAKADFFEKTLVEYGKMRVKALAFAFKGVDPGDLVEYRYVRKEKMDAPPLVYLGDRRPTEVAEVTWFFQPVPELDSRSRWEYAKFLWQPVYVLGNGGPYVTQEVVFPDPENAEGLFMRLEGLPAVARESYAQPFGERAASFVGHYQFPNRDEEKDFWSRVAVRAGKDVNEFVGKSSALDSWALAVATEPRDLDDDLARCFTYINERIRCESFLPARERTYDVESRRTANDLLGEKVATAYDIDRLLVAMLDRLGYESTVFWVRERPEGPFIPEWKTAEQFTGSGVAVRDGDGIRWCYPAAGRGDPAGIPWQYLGCTALLGRRSAEGEEDPFPPFATIPIPESSANELDLTVSLEPGDDLVARGRIRHEWNCRNEVHWISYLASLDEKERIEEVRSRLLPDGVVWQGYDEVCEVDGLTVVFACSLAVEGIVDDAGDLLLLDLSEVRADDFDIDADQRQSDLDFRFPRRCRTTVDVAFPEGFALDSTPPTERIEESFGTASVQSMRAEHAYRLIREVEIPHCMYVKEAAAPMRDFFTRSFAPAKNPVVLVRVSEEGQ